ncbi:restriction endonuclease subunit S [Vibrio alginolyticus]|uniref:restriction endonuclease subunit S n=1 Tax=Vibrio alginolyticus TaxID=663 RepID=UPI001BD661DD|nr:restriction endonuclease subunit S [Vibrio alginolyticus]MBS9921585.1 restriction endonuclease subunit S [Vibrio alginolyticus]
MTGRYKAYPGYKESGVEWLGKVPQNWSIHSLKRTVDGVTNGIWGGEPDNHNDLIVLRVADFNRNQLNIGDDKLTFRAIEPKDRASRLLKKGDLLIEKSGGGDKTLVGCVVLFDKDYPAVTSNFVAKMTPKKGFDSSFLRYAFSQLYAGKVNFPSIKQTTGIQNLDSDAYLQESFVFPSYEEQQKIANFLDHETAKIDTLITKQEKLIELLKEKRQAVISHAVTKGLTPDAPMKDSGVEWLGEVPEHWDVSQLKHHVNTVNGFGFSSNDFQDEGVPFIRAGNIKNKTIVKPDIHLPQSVVDKYQRVIMNAGELVISMVGSDPKIKASAVGQVGLVPSSLAGSVPNQNVVILREKSSLIKQFLFYVVCGTPYRYHLDVFSHKLANQSIISSSLIINAHFAFPTLEEQMQVVDFLDTQLKKYDALVEKAISSIELMKERKTALISAAVTGKIDVRDWKPTENNLVEVA